MCCRLHRSEFWVVNLLNNKIRRRRILTMLKFMRFPRLGNRRIWMLTLIMSLIVYNLVVCAYYRISHVYGSRRWLCWYDIDKYLNSCNIDFGSIKYPLTWRSNTFWFNAFGAMMGVIYLIGLLLHHRSSLIFGTLGYVVFFIYDTYMIVVCLRDTQLCLICSSNIIPNRTCNILIGIFFVQLSLALLILWCLYMYQKKP